MSKYIKKLEKHGYKVTWCLSGWYIAKRIGEFAYKADTLSGLIKLIFGKPKS